jgi:quinol monooxygenase YgiN
MEAQVAVFGVLRFPSENIKQLLPHLKRLVDETYKHDGCIAYDVAEDPSSPLQYLHNIQLLFFHYNDLLKTLIDIASCE